MMNELLDLDSGGICQTISKKTDIVKGSNPPCTYFIQMEKNCFSYEMV